MRAQDNPDVGGRTLGASGSIGRPEIFVLTSVRAFAALEVVLLHALFELGGQRAQSLPAPVLRILTQGQVAVGFFFVLSGFILAYTYSDTEGGLRVPSGRFWRARFARIYPLYFLAFWLDVPRGLSAFLTSGTSPATAWMRIVVSALAYLTLLQSWHPRVTNSWNTPGWSLSTEAFFYAVFPTLLAKTKRWTARRFIGVALTSWALPLVLYVVLARSHRASFELAGTQTLWRSLPLLRLPEFMLGVGAGRLYLSGRLGPHLKVLRWTGAISFVLALVLLGWDLGLPKEIVGDALEAPLFAAMILAAASGAIPSPRWLVSRPLLLLGRASYAVYIVHQPFKSLFLWLARSAGLDTPSPVFLLSYLVLLQAFCIVLFVWIEDPARRLIAKRRPIE
jgi:peptidoglycan/LPS O-acetylase OafA/YrhL